MSQNVLALFPGQGSQKVGMGKELYEQHPLAQELFGIADEALGLSLSKLCFEGPENELKQTAIAQPAILTVSIISYRLSGDRFQPVAAAGHSLGEYSALVAADALRFEDAVRLVNKRGTYMQEAVPSGAGKMVAVLGKELAELEAAIEKVSGTAEIANINAPGQIVVAGDVAGVDEFVSLLGTAKIVELPVSAPFHCSLMKPAAERLRAELEQTEIRKPKFPVYANYSARGLVDPEEIRSSLEQQVCGRVRWIECMENAIRETNPSAAVEFGLGNTLTGMLKRIHKDLPRINIYQGDEA